MNFRANATRAIAKRRLFEAAILPGFFIAVAVAMGIAFVFIAAFVRSIDSSGYNPQSNPLSWVISGLITGGFGETFESKLFAGGPLLIALNVAFVPLLLYLATSSIYKFGSEKTAGAIELLTYGPSDGTAYFLGSLVKDVVLSAVSLLLLVAFVALACSAENLVFDPRIVGVAFALFITSIAVCSYGVLVSVAAESASSAVAAFVGGFIVLLLILAGSYSVATSPVRGLSSVAGSIIQWVSPFFYWSVSVKAVLNGEAALYAAGLAALLALSAGALTASHFLIRAKGVRA